MLEGIRTSPIVVGAYTDDAGGICPARELPPRAGARPAAAPLLQGDGAGALQRRRGARRLHRQARRRVAAYGLAIARAAGIDVADEPQLEFGFLLHDIGKVGVPDAILFKPAALSKDEFVRIASHAEIGSEILRHVDFLAEATLIVRHHHERWDGTGYPDGLRGEQIPLAARVFAIADTLDALTTDRPYRRAVGWEAARKVIHEGAGAQFDPAMIAAYDTLGDDTFARLSEGVHSSSSTER